MALLTPAPTGRWNGRYETTCDPPCSSKQKHGARFRSPDWIADYGAHVGGTVWLDMPVVGEAQVLAIEPFPPLEDGEGRLVTGTFKHTSGEVCDLKLASESKPIGVTGTHPFWSVDREAWVSAVELLIGERLSTLDGTTTVESIFRRPESETVYNIEVEGDHIYRVGKSGILVHNASSLSAAALNAEKCLLQARLQKLVNAGRVTGRIQEFKDELDSDDDSTRWGAEGELIEYELHSAVVNIQGKSPGGDLPGAEIKTRTVSFSDQKNFENFIKDRIKQADKQLKGSGGGELRINLFKFLDIQGAAITNQIIEDAILKALKSRKGIGSDVNNVLVRERNGSVIYSGKPTP